MDDKYIGRQILHYLNLRGLTQREFARLCDINETTLSKYISGERKPKYDTVMVMAYNLHISSDELIGMNEYYKKRLLQEA